MPLLLRVELVALHRLLRGRNGRADGEHLIDGGLARVHLAGLAPSTKPGVLLCLWVGVQIGSSLCLHLMGRAPQG